MPNKQPYLQATLELWQNLRRKTSKKKLVELKLMWSLSCRTYTCPACQTLDGVHVLNALRSAINSSGKWRKNGTWLSTRPYRRNGVDALYTLSHQGLRNCQKSDPTSIGKNSGMLSSETIGRRIFLGHPLVVSEGENGDRHKMVGIVLRV